jgi:DNA polymerase II small subunit/DNA polymerase delta subunit B
MGPFVSETHPIIVKGDTTSTPQELFQNYIGQPLNSLASKYPKTQFFIVPSPDDLIQNYLTLPQPAFQSKLSLRILEPNVHLLSNPAELKLEDKLFSFANFETVIPLVKSQFKK